MPELLCGPALDDLPTDEAKKSMALLDVEESYRLFFPMVERDINVFETERSTIETALGETGRSDVEHRPRLFTPYYGTTAGTDDHSSHDDRIVILMFIFCNVI
eukprot:XP_016664624.1 PREDICTED: uncharacterized protein LOC107885480 [Acyrthosiphon pisum]